MDDFIEEREFQAIYSAIADTACELGVAERWSDPPPTVVRHPHFAGVRYTYQYRGEPVDLSAYLEWEREDTALGRLSWLHSWLWRIVRMERRELLEREVELESVSSRLELETWALKHRVSGWLDVTVERSAVSGREAATFGTWTLGDAIVESPLWRHRQPSVSLRRQLGARLRARADAVKMAIAEEDARAARRALPADVRGIDGLHHLRARLRAFSAPRAASLLGEPGFFVESDGALTYREAVRCVCGDGTSACVQLRRPSSGTWTAECGCRWDREKQCSVKLAAVDHLLDLLGGAPANRGVSGEDLLEELRRPPWDRAVESLVELLGDRGVPDEVDGLPAEFGWEVDVGNGVPRLYPVTVRPKKRGSGVTFQRLPQREWSPAAENLDGVDRLVLRQLIAAAETSSQADRSLVAELLDELAGHRRLYFMKGGARRLDVRAYRATAQLDVSEGSVSILPDFGDDEVPDALVANALFHPGRWAFEFDSAKGILSMCLIPYRIANAMDRLSEVHLPAEAHQALVSRTAKLLDDGLVSLSAATRGEERTPGRAVTVDLQLDDDRLIVRLRAMPIPGGATFPVGRGPDVAYGADAETRFWMKRDRAAERAKAVDVTRALELPLDDEFRWALPLGDDALELVTRIQAIDDRNDCVVRWNSEPVKVAGTVSASNLSMRIGTLRDWLEVSGSARLRSGEEAPIEQLMTAAREGRRWIPVKGGWARIDEKLRRTLQTVSGDEVSPLAAPLLVDLEDQGAEIEGDDSWKHRTERIRTAARYAPPVPDDLEATLRPYQREGFVWLARLAHWAPGAVLADDMGLGKTVQALALLLHRREEGPTLVVGPTSLGFNWRREAERFAPTLDVVLIRSGAELDRLHDLEDGVVVVTSYGLAARYPDEFAEPDWGTLIFDEAQALKNPATQRSQAARDIDAKFTLALTGTPIENRTGELWSVFRAVVPGLLGSRSSFREHFAIPIERRGDASAAGALAALVSPFVLRRVKSEVARELPDRIDVRLDVELSSPERALYDRFRIELLDALDADDELERFEVLAAITRLRQLACHPGLVDSSYAGGSSAKVDLLVERLDELVAEGQRALVFSQFTSLLDLVQPVLEARGVRLLRLDGSTPAARRGELVDAFQAGSADVFLLSTKAAGLGLNLTAATAVFHLDPWWNPAVEDQATDRAHRIGQRSPVTVYRLVSAGTIEEPIYEMHNEKRALVDSVLAGAGSARALTPEELRLLIESHGYEAPEEPDDAVQSAPNHSPAVPTGEDLVATAAPVDPAQLVIDRLEAAVRGDELAEGSARVYRPKAVRFVEWMVEGGRPLTRAGVDAAIGDYVEALSGGMVEAPKSDLQMAAAVGGWVARAFEERPRREETFG